MTEKPFLVVGGPEISAEIEADRPGCLEVIRAGYLAHENQQSVLPHSSFLRFPHRESDRIIALPGYLGADFDVAGIKWIASFPGNTANGIPRASAALLLNDCTTGYPFACLEASVISASRTAASAVLGAEALTGQRKANTIGFIGTGLIAENIRRFFRDLNWQLGEFLLYDHSADAAGRFAADCTADGAGEVRIADSAEQVCAESDLVVLATVAGTPHIHDPELLRHNPVVLHVSLRDLAPELILGAFNITDDVDHAVRERTSLHLTEQRTGNREFVHGTIAELVTGRIERPAGQPAIFSPFGLGVLDLALGSWVHRKITERGGGTVVENFFPGQHGFPGAPA
ncbi:2,3-diaminopropionate biosynthesis protein SbnB [Sciscionella sediminilitoris]|uniref:2,3-diaminopropionate biosynthesis protein SbnB n=1 Tax=Sciscionella sediminilitoris TaxID=1445613 RepID=UPI0004DF466C|nr:2,3-diaminopropionate biosynthesis protein SbnB [Sciscionella sp. SE31]